MELQNSKQTIDNLQVRATTATPRGHQKVDLKDLELANKAAKTVVDLEALLQKRTEDYD